jgi:hypothetical protein
MDNNPENTTPGVPKSGDLDVGSFVAALGVGDEEGAKMGEFGLGVEPGAGAAGHGVVDGSNSTTRRIGGSPFAVEFRLLPGTAPKSRYPITVAA